MSAFIFLTCFHLLLFRRFYFQNPYVYATSEALEQGFPSWLHLGRCLRHRQRVSDPYYYPDYAALPFLSTYYPPHRLSAWLGSFLSLNGAWRLYATTMALHFLFCSLAAYILLVNHLTMSSLTALFGAVTFSSLGYSMKQNSCIVYTLAWVPIWLLSAMQHSISLSAISLGMMLLAGYWPIAIYTIPLGGLLWLIH